MGNNPGISLACHEWQPLLVKVSGRGRDIMTSILCVFQDNTGQTWFYGLVLWFIKNSTHYSFKMLNLICLPFRQPSMEQMVFHFFIERVACWQFSVVNLLLFVHLCLTAFVLQCAILVFSALQCTVCDTSVLLHTSGQTYFWCLKNRETATSKPTSEKYTLSVIGGCGASLQPYHIDLFSIIYHCY